LLEVVPRLAVLEQWLMGHINSMEGTPIPLLLVLAERGTEKVIIPFLLNLMLLPEVDETKAVGAHHREATLQ
jgi:hypothetical protein